MFGIVSILVASLTQSCADELKTMITAMARPKYQADDALSKFVDTSVEDVFTRLDGDGNKELSADGLWHPSCAVWPV
jgi:hypothetical protein